jgi:hypothetical protein
VCVPVKGPEDPQALAIAQVRSHYSLFTRHNTQAEITPQARRKERHNTQAEITPQARRKETQTLLLDSYALDLLSPITPDNKITEYHSETIKISLPEIIP